MKLKSKVLYFFILGCLFTTCKNEPVAEIKHSDNPFITDLNVPVDYARVTPENLEEYASITVSEVQALTTSIKEQSNPAFENIFVVMDDINNKLGSAMNNSFMLYWVSPDSLTRLKGIVGYQLLDSLSISILSDKEIFSKMQAFKSSSDYNKLTGNKKTLVDDMMLDFEMSGVNLAADKLNKYKKLSKQISELSSDYSTNMNSANDLLVLNEKETAGLPEEFKNNYKTANGKYEIPVINATNETVMSNATMEQTRKAFYMKFNNRAANKNLGILDSLIKKRDDLAKVMNYPTYASYVLVQRMAKDPATVWSFINDLVKRSRDKAKSDIQLYTDAKKSDLKNNSDLKMWDFAFYRNQILKKEYDVNNEELRNYFPMELCLKGMFDIYQELLGLKFKKVDNASVWHKEVELYEVYENDKLKGRFYLDLFPRPNKETWFYGVSINSGKQMKNGYEVPVGMLLGNFTRPTKTQPSLLSQNELNTLFHEFGHIMNQMSYHGEFVTQASSKEDFAEAMSQLFENWLWDYNILSSISKHYKTNEVLPKKTFDKMLKAKNLGSGLSSIRSLRHCYYDMTIYDKYNASSPVPTDKIWQDIDAELGVIPFYVEGTHPQASWIHINTNPVYMYGYLWSEVYAQDMFTEFEKKGLKDAKTGMRYRELILANGTQRDIVKAVEEFLRRPSNNKAYIKSLGLE